MEGGKRPLALFCRKPSKLKYLYRLNAPTLYLLNKNHTHTQVLLYNALDHLAPDESAQLSDELDLELDLVELAMRKLDVNVDNRITWPDFLTAVRETPLCLQLLGRLFPEASVRLQLLRQLGARFRDASFTDW